MGLLRGLCVTLRVRGGFDCNPRPRLLSHGHAGISTCHSARPRAPRQPREDRPGSHRPHAPQRRRDRPAAGALADGDAAPRSAMCAARELVRHGAAASGRAGVTTYVPEGDGDPRSHADHDLLPDLLPVGVRAAARGNDRRGLRRLPRRRRRPARDAYHAVAAARDLGAAARPGGPRPRRQVHLGTSSPQIISAVIPWFTRVRALAAARCATTRNSRASGPNGRARARRESPSPTSSAERRRCWTWRPGGCSRRRN